MTYFSREKPVLQSVVRAVVLVALIAASLVSVPLGVPDAQAMEPETLEVWGISGGLVNNPKQWKLAQSTSSANDIGSATAAALGYDDSSWQNVNLVWDETPGPEVANHFRKDFTLDEIGVELFEIEGIKVSMFYDDAAVMYLNGVEVYRSVRGNLDRNFTPYAAGDDIPFDVNVSHGGFELEDEKYISIPDPDGTNECEAFPGCTQSPYIGQSEDPPEIPLNLLRADGVNTFAVTVWNQSGGGSGDAVFNHVFQLLVDPNAAPPNSVFINEAMATNDTAYGVDLDADPELEYPDWFELINTSSDPVNLLGWTISDNSESWVFPSVTIPGNGYLVVAANDKNRTDTTPMQTNFKLSKEGDTLQLTNPEGFVADEYGVLPQQFADNSYGRPNDVGAPTYLATSTPGLSNSAAGNGYAPILRPFPDRLYNAGESVSHQVVAFDPDGDTLSYSLSPMPPGLSIDNNGLITGSLNVAGVFVSNLIVTDSDSDSDTDAVTWVVLPTVSGPAPIVLNEYNAVASDREFLAGGELGNGGDWYEFVVVQDELDLRGYSFELWDLKGIDDDLRLASTVTFGDDVRLGRAPAGTIITISQELPDDLNFDAQGDWHINFQADSTANGAFFAPAPANAVFNSTRSNQTVLIKDASGVAVTPLAGETEAWDNANGGVSGSEVMSLCVDPTTGMTLDPVADYRDNGISTSFGQPNTCVYADPNNVGQLITFNQSLTAIRSAATLGAGSGDTNCDMRLSVSDALAAAQFAVGNRTDSGPCFFDRGGPGFDIDGDAADFTQNGSVSVQDAIAISRCSVGIPLIWCPDA